MYSKPFENLIRVPKFVKSSEPKTLDFQHIRAFPSRKVLRIAAIVLSVGGVLVTSNRRDFERIPGLEIEDLTSGFPM